MDRPEENKSSFSFEMQLDLKEGYGFEDFPEFQPQRQDKEKSADNDEPHFNPQQLAIQRQQSGIKLNPFAGGSDSASKENTRERLLGQQPSNPFATPEGSSNTSRQNRALNQQAAPLQPVLAQQERRQMTFGPTEQPSQLNPQTHARKKEARNSPREQSNFFTFKRGPDSQRLSSNEQLAATIESVKVEIDYYRQEIKKQQYESMRMAEKELEMTYLNQQADDRLAACSKTVLTINEQVELKSREQEELTKLYTSTLMDRNLLLDQVRSGLAADEEDMPTEEETRLLQELEEVAKELQSMEGENQDLQLSRMISSIAPAEMGPVNGSAMLSSLYEIVQRLGSPKFSRNIKMACLKSRWVLWENSELHIGVVYHRRNNELVAELHIGNKTSKELLQFTLQFEGQPKPFFDRETLRERSYMKTEHRLDNIVQVLLKFSIAYEIDLGSPLVSRLALPVVFLQFGEFEPINSQLFKKKWSRAQQKCKSQQCPFDKDIVEELSDFKKYLCNLVELEDRSAGKYLGGVFMFGCGVVQRHELAIKIKHENSMVRFSVATLPGPNGSSFSRETLAALTNSLCFIFAV